MPDPVNENEVFLTLSGFYSGHVYRSTNKGDNWTNISGNLPDMPANDFLIRYIDCSTKEYIVATDAGVYRTQESGTGSYTWKTLADGLPNSYALDFDYNRLSGKLFVSTYGRGVWEGNLSDTIYVRDKLYINSEPSGVNIANSIVVCNGGKLIIRYPCTIKMPADGKIIVKDGGQIDANTGNAVTFTSQTGQWNGIEFQGSGYGTLKNCTFNNAPAAITISGIAGQPPVTSILIDGCTFNQGTIHSVLGNNVTLKNSTINANTSETNPAVSFVYSEKINIYNNTINNARIGISISNTDPFVAYNRVINPNSNSVNSLIGIRLDNNYSADLKFNFIEKYHQGFNLFSSSPVMFWNTSTDITRDGNAEKAAGLYARYNSFPKMNPASGDGRVIQDGGRNSLYNFTRGNGIVIVSSAPVLDKGRNEIHAPNPPPSPPPPLGNYKYITGTVGSSFTPEYFMTENCWLPEPINPTKFEVTDAVVVYLPHICGDMPGTGGLILDESEIPNLKSEISNPKSEFDPPPPPIIINRGHGIYDTILVLNQNILLQPDQMLFSQAMRNELLSNYTNAVTTYQQVITNHHGTSSSINAMKRILTCYDKMNADTSAYVSLRNYYQNLITTYSGDTSLVKVARELKTKTLVRRKLYESAITEYENTISQSSDSLEILCCELNIVETYMAMTSGGDAPNFTGQLAHLKPNSIMDGLRMINEKLHGPATTPQTNLIPREFHLAQNYPNPFNAQTKISFDLPKSVKVSMKIYDILGRLVKTLIDEYKEAGYYSVEFNGSNSPSGVYFYRVVAGKFTDTKKMVLVK